MPDHLRDDTVSYKLDRRRRQGPVHRRAVTPDMRWADRFDAGFCPQCLARLSWNRSLCFDDELEDQCAECLVVWEWEP